MRKVTIALPEELIRQVENAAKVEGRSKSAVMREAIEKAMRRRVRPKPRIPLFTKGLGMPDIAEHIDEYLKGFGE